MGYLGFVPSFVANEIDNHSTTSGKTSQAFREKKVNQSPNLHLLFNKLPVQLNRSLMEQTPSRKRPADVSESDSGSVGCDEKRQRAVDYELEDEPKVVNCTAV